jgi:hypothetical protein
MRSLSVRYDKEVERRHQDMDRNTGMGTSSNTSMVVEQERGTNTEESPTTNATVNTAAEGLTTTAAVPTATSMDVAAAAAAAAAAAVTPAAAGLGTAVAAAAAAAAAAVPDRTMTGTAGGAVVISPQTSSVATNERLAAAWEPVVHRILALRESGATVGGGAGQLRARVATMGRILTATVLDGKEKGTVVTNEDHSTVLPANMYH